MMITLFWILLSIIIYTFLGYPLLLVILTKCNKNNLVKKDIAPSVSVIIAAHNEEMVIKNKLIQTLALDYPQNKFEIIVVSDASTDRTNEIVTSMCNERVRLLAFSQHNGKTFVQNQAAKAAKGEILVFSDATTVFHCQLLKKIVRNFADEEVGAVGGELVYKAKGQSSVGQGNGLYWRFEIFLKKRESQITSLVGVSGCCYAVKKEYYEEIKPELISDFVIAQLIYKKGKKVVYEPEAISYEETNDNERDEFRMRVRVAVRTLYGLWQMKSLLNPFRYGFFSVQLISHKILRYLVPVLLILLFLVNVILQVNNQFWIYKLILYLQVIFYVSAMLGWIFQKRKTFISIAFYFCLTNFALLIGMVKFLRGERQVLWSPMRK
jgi:cellulose synthase/poly-beta-1,6-N-acetylglucosamine synthase-like glycosyltransferase